MKERHLPFEANKAITILIDKGEEFSTQDVISLVEKSLGRDTTYNEERDLGCLIASSYLTGNMPGFERDGIYRYVPIKEKEVKNNPLSELVRKVVELPKANEPIVKPNNKVKTCGRQLCDVHTSSKVAEPKTGDVTTLVAKDNIIRIPKSVLEKARFRSGDEIFVTNFKEARKLFVTNGKPITDSPYPQTVYTVGSKGDARVRLDKVGFSPSKRGYNFRFIADSTSNQVTLSY